MKVLVTGASGGLGSHLVEAFSDRGHGVTGLTRSLSSVGHLKATGADFVTGDVTDESTLADEWFRKDCIIHTAAKVGGSHRWREHLETDLRGTVRILKAAERAGCPRFILISSIAVLDLPEDGSVAGEGTAVRSRVARSDYYIRAKLEVERLVREQEQKGRLAVTVVRPSVFLGRYDRNTTPSILHFLRSSFAGLIGEGENLIPCVHLDELAEFLVKAAESSRTVGRTYQVSGRKSLTLAELLALHVPPGGRPPRARYSRRGARAGATVMEAWARLLPLRSNPVINRFMVDVATLNCSIDCSRAAEDLNWSGRGDLQSAVAASVSRYEEIS